MNRLRYSYLKAFAEYSDKARYLQSLTEQPRLDKSAIDIALFDLEKARLAYNDSRDALAAALLRSTAFGIPRPRVNADHVRSIAGLRWEVAGRPEGTAEEDWHRAEEIVSSAA
jgi:hypothetical protein